MSVPLVIAFDADDTLWHNEHYYTETKERFRRLLAGYADAEYIGRLLDEAEERNVHWYGYGIKSFTLSMIEVAAGLLDGRASGREIGAVLDLGKEMLTAEVPLLPHTRQTLALLADRYELMLITKGDLVEQGKKIERSGVAHYFRYIEVVGSKAADSYRTLLQRYSIALERFVMIGNSLKSDILPVLEIGGRAIYVPYENTWAHEMVDVDPARPGYYQVEHLGLLPELLLKLEE